MTYGLRRTGKTTIIRQILTELPEAEFRKAVFSQVRSRDTMEDIVLLETKIAHSEKKVLFFFARPHGRGFYFPSPLSRFIHI